MRACSNTGTQIRWHVAPHLWTLVCRMLVSKLLARSMQLNLLNTSAFIKLEVCANVRKTRNQNFWEVPLLWGVVIILRIHYRNAAYQLRCAPKISGFSKSLAVFTNMHIVLFAAHKIYRNVLLPRLLRDARQMWRLCEVSLAKFHVKCEIRLRSSNGRWIGYAESCDSFACLRSLVRFSRVKFFFFFF